MAVVNLVSSGELKPSASGFAQIPQPHAGASIDGRVEVQRHADGSIWILFRTWRGKSVNCEGLLFASSPLAPPLMQKDVHGVDSIDMHGLSLQVEENLGKNWYRVSHRLE